MKKLFKNKLGQTSTEYILIFVVVVLVVIGSLAAFGNRLGGVLNTRTDNIVRGVETPPAPAP